MFLRDIALAEARLLLRLAGLFLEICLLFSGGFLLNGAAWPDDNWRSSSSSAAAKWSWVVCPVGASSVALSLSLEGETQEDLSTAASSAPLSGMARQTVPHFAQRTVRPSGGKSALIS